MKIAVGCDDMGEPLLKALESYLKSAHPEIEVVNMSAPTTERVEYYPDVAERVAMAVAQQGYDRGILV